MLKSNPTICVKLNSRLTDVAVDLQRYIDLAYTYGVIKDQNLTNKLEECQEQNQRLKEKVDRTRKREPKAPRNTQEFWKSGFHQ